MFGEDGLELPLNPNDRSPNEAEEEEEKGEDGKGEKQRRRRRARVQIPARDTNFGAHVKSTHNVVEE